MLTMMQRVITNGTANRLIWAHGMKDVEIAGKTGTSNQNRDGWFIAITPKLVVGTWLGAEEQNTHITTKFGGSSVAIPIVGYFLQDVYKDPNININKNDKFVCPPLWTPSECEDVGTPTAMEAGSEVVEDEFFQ
jgi:penicillin-binding protein 1A